MSLKNGELKCQTMFERWLWTNALEKILKNAQLDHRNSFHFFAVIQGPLTRWFIFDYFSSICKKRDNKALSIAKQNVLERYAIVGILEDINNTMKAFEVAAPNFFAGASRLLNDEEEAKKRKRYDPTIWSSVSYKL